MEKEIVEYKLTKKLDNLTWEGELCIEEKFLPNISAENIHLLTFFYLFPTALFLVDNQDSRTKLIKLMGWFVGGVSDFSEFKRLVAVPDVKEYPIKVLIKNYTDSSQPPIHIKTGNFWQNTKVGNDNFTSLISYFMIDLYLKLRGNPFLVSYLEDLTKVSLENKKSWLEILLPVSNKHFEKLNIKL